MNVRLSKLTLLVLALLGTAALWAEEEPTSKQSHGRALVTDFSPRTQRPTAKEGDCDVKDLQTRQAISDEAEKAAVKAFLAVAGAANKYEVIRKSPRLNHFVVPTTQSGELMKRLLDSYDTTIESYGHVGAVLLKFAGGSLVRWGESVDTKEKTPNFARSLRLGGWGIMGTTLVSSVAFSGIRSFGAQSLKSTASELSLNDQNAIQSALEKSLAEPAKYLGDTLEWTPKTRSAFSLALNREVMRTLQKTVDRARADSKATSRLGHEVLASLAPINLIDLIEREKLAGPEQIQALKQLQQIQDLAGKLQSTDQRPSAIRANLTDPVNTLTSRVSELVRFHYLLQEAEEDLPPGAARDALERIIRQIGTAVETLRQLCELGR